MLDVDKKPDNELIAHSLQLWANYIETGNVTLSANDVLGMGKDKPANINVKSLSEDQRDLVKRLRNLAKTEIANVGELGTEFPRQRGGTGLFGRPKKFT